MNMRKIRFLGVLVLFLAGCLAPRYSIPTQPGGDYAQLYSAGAWGEDSDIWIYPDDTFKVTRISSRSRRIEGTRSGYRRGAFHSVVDLVQKENAWKITSGSLARDTDAAETRQREAVGVMDSSHDYVEIRFGGQTMKADYSGAEGYAEMLPSAKLVVSFARIVKRMESLTRETGRVDTAGVSCPADMDGHNRRGERKVQ